MFIIFCYLGRRFGDKIRSKTLTNMVSTYAPIQNLISVILLFYILYFNTYGGIEGQDEKKIINPNICLDG